MPGAGVVAEMQLTDHVALRSGINFLQNGVKVNSTHPGVPGVSDAVKLEAATTLNYLQLPVNVLYMSSGNAIKFYGGGGPYISYGIGGKLKTTTTTELTTGEKEVEKEETKAFAKDPNGNSYFKRVDVGLGLLAGVKFPSGIFANVGYQFSFAKQGEFDVVVCVLALQNMEDISAVYKEAARVLKPGGRLVMVMNHPSFRVLKRSSWGWDEAAGVQYRRIDG